MIASLMDPNATSSLAQTFMKTQVAALCWSKVLPLQLLELGRDPSVSTQVLTWAANSPTSNMLRQWVNLSLSLTHTLLTIQSQNRLFLTVAINMSTASTSGRISWLRESAEPLLSPLWLTLLVVIACSRYRGISLLSTSRLTKSHTQTLGWSISKTWPRSSKYSCTGTRCITKLRMSQLAREFKKVASRKTHAL